MAFYLPIEQPLDRASGCADPPVRSALRGYPPLDFRQVRGMLKGFIDLVFATKAAITCWITNPTGWGRSRGLYPEAMEQAMRAHRYDLQYQLYSLALHRYLRHRIADYDYERHFGGVIYLFLRGMDGQDGGQGIFTTRPVRR
jgi:exodeoxyribonuclease V beta subunit